MQRSVHRPGWEIIWRRPGGAVLASFLVHGAAVLVLANLTYLVQDHTLEFAITSDWQESTAAEDFDPTPRAEELLFIRPEAGGSGSADAAVEAVAEWLDLDEFPALAGMPSLSESSGLASTAVLKPQRATKGTVKAIGRGTGSGVGVGPGSGPGFFGLTTPDTSRVIFVVDGSRSMNHPHESELKTRFRRVKFELLKCILEMQPTQSFYVIFFSNETLPMPARILQAAQPGYRDPYLKWIGDVTSGGSPTDPRDALKLALRMEPDVICFLTDGEFQKGVSRQLMALKQERTAIHTFAFGETLGEETLKALAQNNRGEYRFVP
jgi:hypothetical protein